MTRVVKKQYGHCESRTCHRCRYSTGTACKHGYPFGTADVCDDFDDRNAPVAVLHGVNPSKVEKSATPKAGHGVKTVSGPSKTTRIVEVRCVNKACPQPVKIMSETRAKSFGVCMYCQTLEEAANA